MAEEMGTDSFFSMVDLFILSAAGGFAIYWFFIRNKKQEQPTFKKLTVTYVSNLNDDDHGAVGEFSSPELTLCADSYSVSIPPLCYHSGM